MAVHLGVDSYVRKSIYGLYCRVPVEVVVLTLFLACLELEGLLKEYMVSCRFISCKCIPNMLPHVTHSFPKSSQLAFTNLNLSWRTAIFFR